MKYWIFQSNQVLGPYEPDDLSRHSAFGAESLVCPEGRKGTSMGDWQRAGMVPDLSVALVRSSQSHGVQSSVATLAGLPPEPTLKDLAVLGSLQEKMALLEDVVLQLQEGLRAKDAELAALHQELAGKERQSSVMKSAMEREAADLKLETEERKREAEDLQAQTDEFKRKMTELEERVGVVNRLRETIDKAVEAEKNVEHDVEAQGATLAALTNEMETLRAQLTQRLSTAAPAGFAPLPAPAMSAEIPVNPAPAAIDSPAPPAISPYPAFDAGSMPSFGSAAPEGAMAIPMDPMSAPPAQVSPEIAGTGPEPVAAAATAVASVDAVSPPARKSRKKALIYGGLCGLLVLGAFIFVSGGMGRKKSAEPANMPEAAPLSTPTPPTPIPPAPPAPVIDPREAAIEAAKEWELPDGRKLGHVLETLSPPIGNLSPWMAEPLTNDRVSVNYFAHGGGAGAPTVAYEFEVDLGAKAVVGRNPAAKAVIAGKAAAPPSPPKAKRVTLKPKAKAPKAKPKPKEENLDSLLGTDSPAASPEEAPAKPAKPTPAKRAAKASAQSAPAATTEKAADEALLDDILKE